MNSKQAIRAIVRHELFIPVLLGVTLRIVLMPFFLRLSDTVAQQFSLTSVLNHYDPHSLSVPLHPPFIYLLFQPFLLIASRADLVKFHIFPVAFNAGPYTELMTPIFGDPACARARACETTLAVG